MSQGPDKLKTVADQLERLRALVDAAHGPRAPRPTEAASPVESWLRWRDEWADPMIEEIKSKTVYTLGHQRMPWSEFLRRLQRFEVSCVVDVREVPWSNRTAYGAGTLREALREEAIGYRRWPQLCVEHGRGWHYQDGLPRLLDRIAAERAVCLVCVEEDPQRCHRWTIIGRDLAGLGVKVINIRTRMAY